MKRLKRFLKDRGIKELTSRNQKLAFKRYEKIGKSIRYEVNIDGQKRVIIAHKRKDKVVLRDFYTLDVLASTKRYKLTKIPFNKKLVIRENVKYLEYPIKLRYLRRIPLTKKELVYYSRSQRGAGQIYLNITFTSRHRSMTVEGGSRRPRSMKVFSERNRAYDEAFQGALSQIDFSYEDYTINWLYYAYYESL